MLSYVLISLGVAGALAAPAGWDSSHDTTSTIHYLHREVRDFIFPNGLPVSMGPQVPPAPKYTMEGGPNKCKWLERDLARFAKVFVEVCPSLKATNDIYIPITWDGSIEPYANPEKFFSKASDVKDTVGRRGCKQRIYDGETQWVSVEICPENEEFPIVKELFRALPAAPGDFHLGEKKE